MTLPLLTIASGNYIAHARALASSYLAHHPSAQVFLCLVDRPPPGFESAHEPFTVLLAEDLSIPGWTHLAFRYDIVELNTAVKPFALSHLCRAYGFDRVLYLDPDIVIYDSLDPLEALLATHSIVLTPHLLSPVPSEHPGFEQVLLQYGACNLGFFAARWGPNVEALLRWWQIRLLRYCIRDPGRGFWVDQKWMDLAPCFFPGTYVWRDPACNVAWWNFGERVVTEREGRFFVAGTPLRFAHFSGFNMEDHDVVTSRSKRVGLGDVSDGARRLLEQYRSRLFAHGYAEACQYPYAYGRFDDGTAITDDIRLTYRELDPAGERWPNPFETGSGTFHEHWMTPRTRLGRLAHSALGGARYQSLVDGIRWLRGQPPASG